MLLGAGIPGFLAALLAVAQNVDWQTGAAISDFFTHFIEGQQYKPKSLMLIVGLACSLIYFTVYYFYICSYIDQIWNTFFVQPDDRKLLYFIFTIHNITMGILVLVPHYWWAFALFFHAELCAVFWLLRYRGFRKSIEARGLKVTGRPPIVTLNGISVHDNPEYKRLVTQLYLFRSGVRSLLAKYPLYSGPFIVMIIGCHLVHHSLGKTEPGYETLVIGMYVSASILFVTISSIDYVIRGFWVVDTLKERAKKDDHAYFDNLLR